MVVLVDDVVPEDQAVVVVHEDEPEVLVVPF